MNVKKIIDQLDKKNWELKTLGEIATDIYRGQKVTKEQLGTGDYPAIKCSDINSKLPMYFVECISFINPNLVKNKRYFEYGDILMGDLGDSKSVGKSIAYLGNRKCLLGEGVHVIKHTQNPKFMVHVLNSQLIRKQIKSFDRSGTVFNLTKKMIKQIKIPIPPRHIQDLVADYLDIWTNLKNELERELEVRKKQYEYYKEEMLRLID